MSDPNPNVPGGGVPPKPPEAAKVQPKKETVRISLPPKPAASPTIKLPTLPAGGPAAAGGSGAATGAPGIRPPTAAGTPAVRPPSNTGAPAGRPAGPGHAPVGPRPAGPVSARRVSGLDVGLGVAAAVVALAAIAVVALLLQLK